MAKQEPINPDDQDKEKINQINDKEVIQKILSGEKNLYTLLVRKYNQRLFRIGLSIVNNESEVEDLMQTTYLKAYENLSGFRFESEFSAWITKILVNECLLSLKRRAKKDQRERTILARCKQTGCGTANASYESAEYP
jgi:RNA polymerase sigma factor (sigma-70 family)